MTSYSERAAAQQRKHTATTYEDRARAQQDQHRQNPPAQQRQHTAGGEERAGS